MNFDKLTHDLQQLKTWLANEGHSDETILYKIVVLILLGEEDPEKIIAAAVTNITLQQIPTADLSNISLYANIPDTVYKSVIKLIHLLPRNPESLGALYETLAASKRIRGLYYTPPEVIDFIMANTILQCDITINPKIKILDPACGCGSFLLKAYDILFGKFIAGRPVLRDKFPNEDWTDNGIHRHILANNLWGADIDAVASSIASISLMLKNPDDLSISMQNIITYDSLRRPEDINTPKETQLLGTTKYDFVIGNPPYLSFGLRGTHKLDPEYLEYLRKKYSDSAQYKLSYYALFMQRGIEMLANGGKLGFIVPDTFLLGRYYSKIRQYILENTDIDLIAHVSAKIFKNASTGYLTICVLVKNTDANSSKEHLVNIFKMNSLNEFFCTKPCYQYEQAYFNDITYNRFRIFFSAETKQLIDHIDNIGVCLKTFASGHTGIRSLSHQSNIVSVVEQQEDTWRRGLVSGGQIYRYGIEYRGHWLNIDPQKLYKGGWNSQVINQRKLLIRQTGYSIIASVDNNGLYHLNNIHSFILKTEAVSLDYLLLLLNSRLMSFYYHVVTMEFGRSLAQTDIETLELLPIVVNENINIQAPQLVNTMERLSHHNISRDDSITTKAVAFDEYLNQLVYRIYKLSHEEIQYVEEYESRLNRRPKKSIKQQ